MVTFKTTVLLFKLMSSDIKIFYKILKTSNSINAKVTTIALMAFKEDPSVAFKVREFDGQPYTPREIEMHTFYGALGSKYSVNRTLDNHNYHVLDESVSKIAFHLKEWLSLFNQPDFIQDDDSLDELLLKDLINTGRKYINNEETPSPDELNITKTKNSIYSSNLQHSQYYDLNTMLHICAPSLYRYFMLKNWKTELSTELVELHGDKDSIANELFVYLYDSYIIYNKLREIQEKHGIETDLISMYGS